MRILSAKAERKIIQNGIVSIVEISDFSDLVPGRDRLRAAAPLRGPAEVNCEKYRQERMPIKWPPMVEALGGFCVQINAVLPSSEDP